MFKNVRHVKTKYDKNASENLLNVTRIEIIWSSFLSLGLNKFFRKLVLVIKSLFQLLWHWFTTLS